MKMPNILHLHRRSSQSTSPNTTAGSHGIEGLLVQHAFVLFLASTILLLLAFLFFFYVYFYRVISGDATAISTTIHSLPKTINLGSYQNILEVHATKVDTGKEFSSGEQTIRNPFVSE
jgi:ABC-type maltose transport system permease subunit